MTAPKLPNFILAGAGESGTTSLYRYLKQHPQVFMSPVKEPNFFAAADILSLPDFKPLAEGRLAALLAEGGPGDSTLNRFSITRWEDYLRLFQDARDQVARGEASVMYLWFPSAAPAIHRTLPEAKLVFVLRDPAERLHTLYLRSLRAGHRIPFREWVTQAMRANPDRRQSRQQHPIPLDCGRYATHLQPFFDRFPPEQIRVYLYEAFRTDPRGVLRDMFGFLGVDPDYPVDLSGRHNETTVPRFPAVERLRQRILGRTRLTAWLPAGVSQVLRASYNVRRGSFALAPDDRRLVVDYYREEILRAGDLIGRDLSAWLR